MAWPQPKSTLLLLLIFFEVVAEHEALYRLVHDLHQLLTIIEHLVRIHLNSLHFVQFNFATLNHLLLDLGLSSSSNFSIVELRVEALFVICERYNLLLESHQLVLGVELDLAPGL